MSMSLTTLITAAERVCWGYWGGGGVMGGMCGMTGMYADIPANIKFKETIHVIGKPYFIVLVIKNRPVIVEHFVVLADVQDI